MSECQGTWSLILPFRWILTPVIYCCISGFGKQLSWQKREFELFGDKCKIPVAVGSESWTEFASGPWEPAREVPLSSRNACQGAGAGLPGAAQVQLKPRSSYMGSGHRLALEVWRNGPESFVPVMGFGGGWRGEGGCAGSDLGLIQPLHDLGTE